MEDYSMKLKYCLLILITQIFSLYSMEKPEALSSEESIKVQPISETPITKIPKYVYENCNQATRYNWNEEFLEKLKKQVKNFSKEKVSAKYPNKNDFIRHAEGFDWVYGLNYLEENYLKPNIDFVSALSIDEVKKVNGFLSRLVSDIPGQFRKHSIIWRKRNFTNAETIFFEFIEHNTPEDLFIGNNDFNLRVDDNKNISILAIKRVLEYYKANPRCIHGLTNQALGINVDEIKTWAQESLGLHNNVKKNIKPNFINLTTWINKRIHMFPAFDVIEEQVLNALDKIKDPSMHPVRKAAFIWYEIVRIHISHEANKRSGKALASIILLQNGYLPPLIDKEDEKLYLSTLLTSLHEDNFEIFLNFVIKMIEKTQEKYKSGLLKI